MSEGPTLPAGALFPMVINEHGPTIWCATMPDDHSVFDLYKPRYLDEHTHIIRPRDIIFATSRHGGTIGIVVDVGGGTNMIVKMG